MTHGFVLSGGGAFAAFEVGVLKAMATGNSPVVLGGHSSPNIFAGTSAGSFNSAILVSKAHNGFREAAFYLENLWMRRIAGKYGPMENGVYRLRFDPIGMAATFLSPSRVLQQMREVAEDTAVVAAETLVRSVRILNGTGSLVRRMAMNIDISVMLCTQPYARLLKEVIDAAAVRSSPHQLMITVTDWRHGTLHIFRNDHMTDLHASLIVQASSSIPGLFPPVNIGDRICVDGGVLMNTPLRPVIDAGADVISVVELEPCITPQGIESTTGTLTVLDRILAVAAENAIRADINQVQRVNLELDDPGEIGEEHRAKKHRKVTIHRFRPMCDLGTPAGMLNMDAGTLKQFIQLGFEAALNHNCKQSNCVIAQ